MFDSMYLGLRVVFPLLFYMGIGIFIRKVKWVSENTLNEMNRVVFRIFMSILLFLNAYSVDIYNVLNEENSKLLTFTIGTIGIILFMACLLSKYIVKDKKRNVIVVQAIFRSNLALYGLPISIAIYGDGNQGAVTILVAIVVPIYNIVSEILLSNSVSQKTSLGQVLKKVLTNPLVLGALLGLIFSLCKIQFPNIVLDTLEKTSKVATPLAFVIIGGSLAMKDIKEDWKAIAGVSVIRLVFIPSIVLTIAVAIGFRTYSLVALLGVFAAPVAVSSYTMAKDRGIAAELAGELVAVTTLVSVFTIFLWITVLNYFNFI